MNSIYSNARAKALTNNLLGISRLKRMLDSTPIEALKILSEVNFGDGKIIEDPLEFEKLIYSEERKLLEFIRNSCASENFRDYFFAKYDYHNAEALIKAKYLKIDPEKLLVCHGKYESSFMSEKIMTDDYRFFSKYMAKALSECDVLFVNGSATGENISNILKKAMYNELDELSAKESDLRDIFKFSLDMQNVSVALRTRNYEKAKDVFLSGGEITNSELISLCVQPIEQLREKTKFYKNGQYIRLALDSLEKELPLSEFEKMVDEYTLDYLKKKKYSTEGLVPFMLYCYYKKAEINNVRIIMVGLINSLERNQIERRIRQTYEG